MTHQFSLGVFYMVLSAVGLSLSVFFSKIGLETLTLDALIFYRFLSSLVICCLFLWVSRRFVDFFPVKNMGLHLSRAFFVLLAQYSIFYYLEHHSLLNATVLLNTGPLFIPLIEWAVLRQKVGKSSWIGVIVAFIGVLLILQPQKGLFAWSSFIGLLAGLSQGASQVLFGHTSQKEKAEMSILYLFCLCTFISGLIYLLFDFTRPTQYISFWPITLIIILLGFASTANQLFRGTAYKFGKPSNLATFLYVSVLLSGILDWAYFHHIPNALTLMGGFLVILGGVLKIVLRYFILKRQNK